MREGVGHRLSSHFTDEGTEARCLGDVRKVTELCGGGPDSECRQSFIFLFFYFYFFSTFIYFWDRERQSMNGGGAEREGDTESETGSRL